MARKSNAKAKPSPGLGFGLGVGFGFGSMTGGFGFGGGSLWAKPTIEQPKTRIATKNNCFKYFFILVILSHSAWIKGTEGKD